MGRPDGIITGGYLSMSSLLERVPLSGAEGGRSQGVWDRPFFCLVKKMTRRKAGPRLNLSFTNILRIWRVATPPTACPEPPNAKGFLFVSGAVGRARCPKVLQELLNRPCRAPVLAALIGRILGPRPEGCSFNDRPDDALLARGRRRYRPPCASALTSP